MSDIKIEHYRTSDMCTIPDSIGSYVITHTSDNIHAEKYVGSTKYLHSRICDHCDKNILYVDIYVIDNIDNARSLERILMNLIKPSSNKRILYLLDKDNTLMKEILENGEIKDYIFENTIRIGCRHLRYIIDNETEYNKHVKSTEEFKSLRTTLPVFPEELAAIKEKQLELINKRGKILTLTEVVSEVVRKGLPLLIE